MKVVAYTALHYGRDYLGWAIRSVIDHIDEYHVLYSPVGSHGHRTVWPCPDTEDALFDIATRASKGKLHWHRGDWTYENQQRESIYQFATDADMILVLDADEIWPKDTIEAIVYDGGRWLGTLDQRRAGGVRFARLPMIHYWRSFYRCVLRDPAFPVRVIFPKVQNRETFTPNVPSINHMGYAQRSEIVQYKLLTHGHRNEFRRDIDWYRDRFAANAQEDCHPVGSEYWNPELVDPLAFMPTFMAGHPYFHLEIIP